MLLYDTRAISRGSAAANLDLAQGDALVPGVVLLLHFLDGKHLPGLLVAHERHGPVRAVAKLLDQVVAVLLRDGGRDGRGLTD